MSEDRYVSRRQAAALARVHYNTVRQWERQGRLRTRKFFGPTGEEVHVLARDLETLLRSRPEPAPGSSSDRTSSVTQEEFRRCRETVARLEGEVAALRDMLREVLQIAKGGAPQA